MSATDAERQPRPPKFAAYPDEEWERARKRLEAKRKLRYDLVAYLFVNTFLVVAWAITDTSYFWPGWVIAIWGVFLMLDAYRLYGRRPITEADIEAEMRRHNRTA